jgi:hypothetical protein
LTARANLESPETRPEESEALQPETEKDDSEIRLAFWRDSFTFLKSLAVRISQLRMISFKTGERIRQHGTAEVVIKLASSEQDSGRVDVVRKTPPNVIMAQLYTEYRKVKERLDQLQILVTAVVLGRVGPYDREYCQNWIEHHVHEDEKKEFEETALSMGYSPNSVPMDPLPTPSEKMEIEYLEKARIEHGINIGVAGEYRGLSFEPEKLPSELRGIARYLEGMGTDANQRLGNFSFIVGTLKDRGVAGLEEKSGQTAENPSQQVEQVESQNQAKEMSNELNNGETLEGEQVERAEEDIVGERKEVVSRVDNAAKEEGQDTWDEEDLQRDLIKMVDSSTAADELIANLRASLDSLEDDIESLEQQEDDLRDALKDLPQREPR